MHEAKGRVLLVDPDPMMRLAVGREIEALGWDVLCVNTGAEAVRVVALGLHVDVLLTELQLPDGGGAATAADVARLAPHVRVAFLSAAAPADEGTLRQAPCVVKPCAADALARALAQAAHAGGDGRAGLTPRAPASRRGARPRRVRTVS